MLQGCEPGKMFTAGKEHTWRKKTNKEGEAWADSWEGVKAFYLFVSKRKVQLFNFLAKVAWNSY